MEIITYLIERELLARRTVVLPFIGELARQRVSSHFAFDRSHLIAPHDCLTLTADAQQEGEDFIGLIAAEANVSHIEAIEIYNEWYASSTDATGATLTIEAVCSIDLICYAVRSIDDSFAEYLMPLGDEPIAIGRPLDSRGIEVAQIIIDEPAEIETNFTPPVTPPVLPPVTSPVSRRPPIANPHQAQSQANQARPTNPAHAARQTRPTRPPRRPRQQSGASTVALTASIAVAVIAALYIAYYLLTSNGILAI